MKRWLLVLVACGGASAPAYPLHPTLRSASGGPVEVLGAVATPGTIPYAPAMMLRCALRLAGGPTGNAGDRAEITRGTDKFAVPVRAIVAGDAPDLELAPGDEVFVTGDLLVTR